MTTFQTTITAIAIHRAGDSPIFGESTTIVRLDDEGGGPFIVIEQADAPQPGAIRLDPDECEIVMREVRRLLEQKAIEGDEENKNGCGLLQKPDEEPVLRKHCGEPSMHMGDWCFACAQEHQGEYRREDDPNFNEASTGDLLAQAEYWDAVARVKEVRND